MIATPLVTVTTAGYEIFNAAFQLIGYAEELVAPRGPDAVGLAKAYASKGRNCIVVRVSDSVPMSAYGSKPGRLLVRWRSECLPGVERAVA